MRRIKLLILCLSCLALSLPLLQEFFPGFVVTGQGTGNLTAPTGVIATDNVYSTKIGVTWDAVRGATLYRVFRNSTNDPVTAVSLGTTASSSFFDNTAVAGQTFFFWVRAENGNVVSPLSQSDPGIRANGLNDFGPVAPLNPPPAPPGNQVTATKAFLGKTLFWDEQLSSTRTVACGSCHFSTNGGSDPRSNIADRSRHPGADGLLNTADDVFGSPGVPSNNPDGTYNWSATFGFAEQVTGRKSKSYVDAGYSNLLFWDGRATGTFTDPISGAVLLVNGAALESQVLGPPVNSSEMAHSQRNWADVASRVAASKPLALSPSIPSGLKEWIGNRSYPELFLEAFGSAEVTPARIAMAIATFERTVYSDQTPWDAAVSQIAPLTPAENRGQGVFNASRCNLCHAGTLFTDNQFHNIGLRPQTEDPGRFAVTGDVDNLGEFRTPSLRNVALRAPYMHNGRVATLAEVVEFYNRGGDFDAPNINRNRIRPLNLSPQQKADLIAFLTRPLTDPRVAAATAPFDRPTLYAESQRVPQVQGTGTAGSGGITPQVTAIEPPLLGNPHFTVGVSRALGQAQAVLVIDTNDPGTGPSIPASASLARISLQLSGSGAGQGFGSVSLPIPGNQALLGSTFFGRWFITDANVPGGVAVTPAFEMTIFGEAVTSEPTSVELTSSNYVIAESGGTAQVNVSRTEDSSAATVDYATRDSSMLDGCNLLNGTASSACDYGTSVGTLRFAAGESSKTIFIPIVDDAYAEGSETLTITLTNPVGMTLGSATSATITIQDNETVNGANPIDGNDFFIRQQYIDFLGREPDPAGLAGWRNVLNNCGISVAQPCDRIEVSAGFFRSEEFQSRGYFIYRFFSALGRVPLSEEFYPDFAKVSGFLTADQLEANKAAYVNSVMARADFQTKYGSTMNNPTAYVEALLQTVGLPAHPSKQSWINTLNASNTTTTRGQVLRQLVESAEVFNKYFNEAFVIMQYFGYLRRTADASYLSWINTMNQTGGDYRIMINGFMNSAEYRRRFGP
ncbi:MAG TPA: cytochrome c peroxidase [Pyrinomonadaceae bacterium]|nr:cytochrome c peroxidase [Pyrinomonadaceae bacterium]